MASLRNTGHLDQPTAKSDESKSRQLGHIYPCRDAAPRGVPDFQSLLESEQSLVFSGHITGFLKRILSSRINQLPCRRFGKSCASHLPEHADVAGDGPMILWFGKHKGNSNG